MFTTFLDRAAGQNGIALLLVLVAAALILLFLFRRRRRSRPLRSGSAPGPRLAVIETAVVDAERRLVLVRRDGVEHLLLTGGPNDLVVEPAIGAEVAARPHDAPRERREASDGPTDRTRHPSRPQSGPAPEPAAPASAVAAGALAAGPSPEPATPTRPSPATDRDGPAAGPAVLRPDDAPARAPGTADTAERAAAEPPEAVEAPIVTDGPLSATAERVVPSGHSPANTDAPPQAAARADDGHDLEDRMTRLFDHLEKAPSGRS